MLKGPDNADHYRVKVGRYGDRWYSDPLPADDTWPATPDDAAYPSISTVKKTGGADWTYVALKRVAQHAEPLPKGYDARYAALKNINDLGLKQAQKRGDGVHKIAESKLRGYVDPMAEPNSDAEQYRGAVDAFFDTYQPELVAVEFVAFHRDLNGVGYGGTGDAVLCIDGANYLVDWKSRGEDSEHGAYPEEGAQIAGYARAQYWIVDGPRRIAPVELAGGLIVSIKPDGYRVYPVELDKAFDHWTKMHAWWCARRDERKPIGRAWAPRKVEGCPSTTPATKDSNASTKSISPPQTKQPGQSLRDSQTSSESKAPASPATTLRFSSESNESASNSSLDSIRARIRALPPDAKPHLQHLWPVGVPRGPSGPFTSEQLQNIAAVLDTVEWEYTDKETEWTTTRSSASIGSKKISDGPKTGSTSTPTKSSSEQLSSSSPPSGSQTSPRATDWQPPEEGPDVDLTEVKLRITNLSADRQALFNRILVESKKAGRSFHLLTNRGGKPSMRRALIVAALADIIDAADGDEKLVRNCLLAIVPPPIEECPIGMLAGSLTTQQAAELTQHAQALLDGTEYIGFTDDYQPIFLTKAA